MIPTEAVLEALTKDGTMDVDQWPRLLNAVLARLEKNVYDEFPTPTEDPRRTPILPSSTIRPFASASRTASTSNSDAPKENSTMRPPPPPVTPSRDFTPANPVRPTFPRPVQNTYTNITTLLTTQFASHPPHTIQRFAELILRPKQHHKYLPAYLNAIERTISVASGANIFPLPPLESISAPNVLVNGASTTHDQHLGGALLTPIPWLQSTNGSDDGMDVEVEAVTQGELLRREQQESAPPAPITTGPSRSQVQIEGALEKGLGEEIPGEGHEAEGWERERGEHPEADTDAPHVRGPERIGVEDMGPQDTTSRLVKPLMFTNIGSDSNTSIPVRDEAVTQPLVHRDGESLTEEKEKDTEQLSPIEIKPGLGEESEARPTNVTDGSDDKNPETKESDGVEVGAVDAEGDKVMEDAGS